MEKIEKLPVTSYTSLSNLAQKYKSWGEEFLLFKTTSGRDGQTFSWREGCRGAIIQVLSDMTLEHCSFCDGYPLGTESLEPIEHYFPKADYPLLAYDLVNLYYCCDKCNSEANKKQFEETLRPDITSYSFDRYFYFDLSTGQLKVKENLEDDDPDEFERANQFLLRYGINNNPKRNQARKDIFFDIKNNFLANDPSDGRKRRHFKYRYVYDLVEKIRKDS